MPLYLDRHHTPGATAEEVAAAHERDLAAQGKHDVRYLTYWFEPEELHEATRIYEVDWR